MDSQTSRRSRPIGEGMLERIWHIISWMLEGVFATREATWSEDFLYVLTAICPVKRAISPSRTAHSGRYRSHQWDLLRLQRDDGPRTPGPSIDYVHCRLVIRCISRNPSNMPN